MDAQGRPTIVLSENDYIGKFEIYQKFFRCSNCGNELIRITSKYCSECGIKIKWDIKEHNEEEWYNGFGNTDTQESS